MAGKFIPKALLYLSAEDLQEIAARLEDGAILRIQELKEISIRRWVLSPPD